MKEVSASLRQLLSGSYKALCSSWGTIAEDNMLYSKKLLPHNSVIILRYVYLPTDLSLIQGWINLEYNAGREPINDLWPELLQAYTDIQQSDYAQAFMCVRDGAPVCVVEVRQAQKHEIALACPVDMGDYVITLLADPRQKAARQLYINLLQMITAYFFLFSEVTRILLETDVENYPDPHVLEQARFRFLQKTHPFPYTQSIYCCTRDSIPPNEKTD